MSTTNDGPLVSVITPVYNGEDHLAECIRSVLAQTYKNFEYTIVNNCSTDRTVAIAEEFAAADSRIRVAHHSEFLDVVSSINRAFTLISPDSKYCKLVAADDWLFENCISSMIELAEQNPSVGMVTSYVLSGSTVGWDGLPYPSTVTRGTEICRKRLLKDTRVFGGPSASMIRSDILRTQVPFYNPGNYSGDNEAYLELLKDNDFGFVHQVLSFRRRGEASRTTHYLERVGAYPVAVLEEILHFGRHYLSEHEYEKLMRKKQKNYYRFLAQALFDFKGKEFWDYHRHKSQQLDTPIRYDRVAGFAFLKLLDVMLNPKRSIESVYEKLSRR